MSPQNGEGPMRNLLTQDIKLSLENITMIKKTVFKIATSATLVLAFAASSHAANVSGDVKTDVDVGDIKQDVKMMRNENNLEIGNVKGRGTSVSGNVETTVKVDNINQTAKGVNNKNQVKIGNVE